MLRVMPGWLLLCGSFLLLGCGQDSAPPAPTITAEPWEPRPVLELFLPGPEISDRDIEGLPRLTELQVLSLPGAQVSDQQLDKLSAFASDPKNKPIFDKFKQMQSKIEEKTKQGMKKSLY